MTGRPINQDRLEAIEFGYKTYNGAAHYRCGTTERYVSGGGCVHCAKAIAHEQREARKFVKEMERQKVENRDEDLLDSPAEDGLETDDPEARRQASFDELM